MSPPAPSQTPHQASILIVDDEPIQLRAMVAELNTLGFETLIARNGADGLAKAESGRPDLILLDILMPGLDGYQTCRRLKASSATRAIPVIFLSVLSDTAEKLRGFEAGCIDYITKPFEHRELLARVSAHLQQRSLFTDMADAAAPPHADDAADSCGLNPAKQLVDFQHHVPGPGRQLLLTLGWKFSWNP